MRAHSLHSRLVWQQEGQDQTEAAVLAKVDYALNLKDNNPEGAADRVCTMQELFYA